MSTAPMETMIATVFTAPLGAVTQAERAYRREWIAGLRALLRLAASPGQGAPTFQELFAAHLKTAPVMKLNGRVEMGLTMRIASVSKREYGLGLELGVGPIGFGGNVGGMTKSAEESVLQVHASFTLTNEEVSLAQHLSDMNLTPTTAEDLSSAVDLLATKLKLDEAESGQAVAKTTK